MLLIGDNHGDALLILKMLAEGSLCRFELETVDRLSDGMQRLSKGGMAAVLLDLSLPDSAGLQTISALHEHAPDVPIVVLTGSADEALGVQALGAGAQDYLVKGRTDSALLVRSLRYAIERKRLERSLEQQALMDELSGVYNRRGFYRLAEQQLRLLRRIHKEALLVLVDIEGLKQINDTFGHVVGDVCIADAAGLLRKTFRDSDLIGRMGGDEFVVLAIEVGPDDLQIIPRRLTQSLAAYNKAPDRRSRLSFSIGFAVVKPEDGSSLDHFLKEADHDLYLKRRGSPRAAKPPVEIS